MTKNGSAVAVLDFYYWKNHLGSDPHVVGQTLAVNGHPFEIVGVAAPGFDSAIWGSPADIFVPMTMKAVVTPAWDQLYDHPSRWLNIMGRLKQRETRAQAQVAMAPLWRDLRTAELPLMGDIAALSRWICDAQPVAGIGRIARILVFARRFADAAVGGDGDGGTGCADGRRERGEPGTGTVAGRIREFSMRYALGAKRGQVLRQLLTEGLLLGVLGGAAGLALAPAVIRFLVSRLTSGDGQPPFLTSLDGRVLAFNFAVAIGVSLLFALAPALRSSGSPTW